MKRIICIALTIIILSSFSVIAFADSIDWSTMTNDEISAEILRARKELADRQMALNTDGMIVKTDDYSIEIVGIIPFVGGDDLPYAAVECIFTNFTDEPVFCKIIFNISEITI